MTQPLPETETEQARYLRHRSQIADARSQHWLVSEALSEIGAALIVAPESADEITMAHVRRAKTLLERALP